MYGQYQQPEGQLNTTGGATIRQPFNIEEPRARSIPPLTKMTIVNVITQTIIIAAVMGGFIYINNYFITNLITVVVNNSHGPYGTAPSNCLSYNCFNSPYFFTNNYATY